MQDSFQVHTMDFNTSTSEEPQTQTEPTEAEHPMQPTRTAYNPQSSQQSPYNRPLPIPPHQKKSSPLFPVLALLVIIGGAATGYGMSKLRSKEQIGSDGGSTGVVQQVATGKIHEGDIFGSQDATSFKDTAEGYLQIGGIDGEGSHKLLRDGGPSQTVYLTSASTDLDKFEGMIVKVWGETFKGQKAGWLMDVGRVQVVTINADLPAGAEASEGTEVGD